MTIAHRWTTVWHTLVTHRWKLLSLFVAVLLPLVLFGVLAEDVIERQSFFFDDPFLLYVHSYTTPTGDAFMLLMSRLGYQWGVAPLDTAIVVGLLIRKRIRDAMFFGLAVIGAVGLNAVVKLVFSRDRPKLWPSLAPETSFSFPSGHSMASMALVSALVVLCWPTRWRYLVLILGSLFVLLVSFSRIYLGVHYPSDVLAGWTASLAWVMGLSFLIYRRLGKPTPQGM